MHIYVLVSTIYIGYLIYSQCRGKKIRHYDFIDNRFGNFPIIHYVNKVNVLNYFTDTEQFNRLCVLYDNPDIYEKMINVIENDDYIQDHYQNVLSVMTDKYFGYNHPVDIPIEINGLEFKTNLQRLSVIMWFIENDYFLFVE